MPSFLKEERSLFSIRPSYGVPSNAYASAFTYCSGQTRSFESVNGAGRTLTCGSVARWRLEEIINEQKHEQGMRNELETIRGF